MDFIASMSEVEMNTPFDFSSDAGKKEAHWSRDSFTGGLLYKLTRKENPLALEKDELEDYLRFANSVAVFCVTKKGAILVLPLMEDIKDLRH